MGLIIFFFFPTILFFNECFFFSIFGWAGSSLPWRLFSGCDEWGRPLLAVPRLPMVVAFLIVECGL